MFLYKLRNHTWTRQKSCTGLAPTLPQLADVEIYQKSIISAAPVSFWWEMLTPPNLDVILGSIFVIIILTNEGRSETVQANSKWLLMTPEIQSSQPTQQQINAFQSFCLAEVELVATFSVNNPAFYFWTSLFWQLFLVCYLQVLQKAPRLNPTGGPKAPALIL